MGKERARWQRSRRRGVRLSPRTRQEYSSRHRRACRAPAESHQEGLSSGKECTQNHTELGGAKDLAGGAGVSVGPDLPTASRGTEAGV